MGIPVWFDWDGEVVRMFVGKDTPKVHRLRRDPKASVLVTNHIDEPERWVAFDGLVSITDTGGFELAERLAPRYWGLISTLSNRRSWMNERCPNQEEDCKMRLGEIVRNGSEVRPPSPRRRPSPVWTASRDPILPPQKRVARRPRG